METIGDLLRTEREKKGLSIKEIETAISIRALYITAIEEGNYSIVPGEVYLKGFIRNYANYLGLNGQEIVASYRQAQQPVIPETTNDSVESPPKTSAAVNTKSRKLFFISLLAVCLVGSAWWALANQTPPKAAQETKEIQTTPAPAVVTPTQPAQPVAPVQTKPVVIVAKYTEQCWTAVVADNKQIYEGTPQNGTTMTWEAQKNITITAGNAGGVDITYNGEALGKIGKKGEVLVKTYVAKQ